MVGVLAIGPKVRGFKSGRRRWIFESNKKYEARLPTEGKLSRRPYSARFYGLLKNPSKYERHTS
jgi:hypothetical protein